MAKYEAGFIGAGNMGGALCASLRRKRPAATASPWRAPRGSAWAGMRSGSAARRKRRSASSRTAALSFLGVKPQMVVGVVEAPQGGYSGLPRAFVSMLAGVSLEKLALLLGADKKIIRIMPNTPCAVGRADPLRGERPRERGRAVRLPRADGAPPELLDELNEHLIDAASAVSGCGPAYAYLFIEALADGGVKNGLPRAKAQRYAAQMLLGSAEMVLRTGRHPGQLKDEVCSPAAAPSRASPRWSAAACAARASRRWTPPWKKPNSSDKKS